MEPQQNIDPNIKNEVENAKLNRDEQIVRHIYAQSVEKRLAEQKHSFFRGHESQIANLLKGLNFNFFIIYVFNVICRPRQSY